MSSDVENTEIAFKRFKQKIAESLRTNDKEINSGFEANRLFYLSERALFIIGGKVRNTKLDDLLNNMINYYKSEGKEKINFPNAYCFLFPELTLKLTSKEISGIFYNKLIKANKGLIKGSPVLVDYLLLNRKKKIERLKKLQEKKCLTLIKELLLELDENNEVILENAINVIKEEGSFSELDDKFIQEALLSIVTNLEEFKYIRLTRCIKRLDIVSTNLNSQIDQLLQQFGQEKI